MKRKKEKRKRKRKDDILERETQELGEGAWKETNKLCLKIKWLKKASEVYTKLFISCGMKWVVILLKEWLRGI